MEKKYIMYIFVSCLIMAMLLDTGIYIYNDKYGNKYSNGYGYGYGNGYDDYEYRKMRNMFNRYRRY